MSTGHSEARGMGYPRGSVGRCTCLYELYMYMCAYVLCGAGDRKWVRSYGDGMGEV